MFKPGMVAVLVFVCTVVAIAQTATSVQVTRAEGEVTGPAVVVVNGEERTIASGAYTAWIADGGRVVFYSSGDSVGGYEREGQSLWRYDVAKRSALKLMTELYMITRVVETKSASGGDALLVTMMDGGLGASHVAVVDAFKGEVWREIMARFVGLRNGHIAVGLYNPKDFESEKPQPSRIVYFDLDQLLQMPANPYVPVQTSGKVASVSGTITYREMTTLPADAVVNLELVEVSTGKRIAQHTIMEPGQVPMSFELYYDPSLIKPSSDYQVNASIVVNGSVMFRNTNTYLVITGGNPNKVGMVLTKA